jgi:hypothetical protein
MSPDEPDALDVRRMLIERYERLAEHALGRATWLDRIEALREGEISVEPGWMLRPIIGASIDRYALYRVYPDGRVERDRRIERAELERFRAAGHDPDEGESDCS